MVFFLFCPAWHSSRTFTTPVWSTFQRLHTRNPSSNPFLLWHIPPPPSIKIQRRDTCKYKSQRWRKKTRGERRSERKPVLPRACDPFYYHGVWAFITTPDDKYHLKPMGRQRNKSLLNGEWVWMLICSAERWSIAAAGWRGKEETTCWGQRSTFKPNIPTRAADSADAVFFCVRVKLLTCTLID